MNRGSQNLVAPATKFRTVVTNICSIITAIVHLYTKMYVTARVPEKRAPDNSKFHRSLQDFESSVLNLMPVALQFEGDLMHVALMAPRI